MTDVLLLIVAAIILSFGFVVAFGAPYVPTLSKQAEAAFALLELKPGETLLELGCGDGRMVVAAARRGIKVIGYELNPLLALLCWLRTLRYRRLVRIRIADFWRADWPRADAAFGFILPRLMHKLDAKIMQEKRGPLRVASFAFEIPGKKAAAAKDGVFLYRYK